MATTLYSKRARGFVQSALEKRDLRASSLSAFVSAPLFFLAAVCSGVANYIENESRYRPTEGLLMEEHYRDYTMLNATLLRRIWKDRLEARGALLAGDTLGAMGWFTLIAPVQGLALVGRRETGGDV